MRRGATFRTKKQNKGAMIGITCVLVMFIVGTSFNSYNLGQKRAALLEKEAELKAQIEEQENRKQELVELKKYTQTKKYAEEVAKDKLGLVYEDEIIFKPKE